MLETRLAELAQTQLPGPDYFVAEVQLRGTAQRPKVVVLVEGDAGVTVDVCAAVSRGMAEQIETQALLEGAYVLEVSSPGVDYPLTRPRQYPRHVGRRLEVTLRDGSQVNGRLLEVTAEGLLLEVAEAVAGQRRKVNTARPVAYHDVEQSKVMIAF